jgi:FkbM family methyltransferase
VRSLLNEPIESARVREGSTLSSLVSESDGTVVIFGAGKLGMMCYEALKAKGIYIRAFCDNSPSLLGTRLQDVPVLSPEAAIAEAGETALFVVAIWSGTGTDFMADRLAFLKKSGCRHVTTFPAVLWANGKRLLPFYSLELPTDVLSNREHFFSLAELLEDELSLLVLEASLKRRLFGQFPRTSITSPQYFPADIFRPITQEVFVDGGAYTGDTLAAFLRFCGGTFCRYIAVEPDPRNWSELCSFIANQSPLLSSRLNALPVALYSDRKTISFDTLGATTSSISAGEGFSAVQAMPLDSVSGAEGVTFVKLDIEGAEMQALLGAEKLLAKNRPLVAVCVYHHSEDIWMLPLELNRQMPDHAIFLREHGIDGWEMVCYCVPRERLTGSCVSCR